MNRLLCVLIILFPSALCSGGEFTSLIANQLAVATMNEAVDGAVDKVPRIQCQVCNGIGKVKAGDGRTVVWRECDNCYDDNVTSADAGNSNPEPVPEDGWCTGPVCTCENCPCPSCGRSKRILMFTARWCIPCQQVKGDLVEPDIYSHTPNAPLTRLLHACWSVGQHQDDMVQLIDVDEHPELQARFSVTALPTFILYENHQEVARLVGFQDEYSIAQLLKGIDERPREGKP